MSLDAIGTVCTDVEKSIEFYNILGVEFEEFGEGHFEGTTPIRLQVLVNFSSKIHWFKM